MSTTHTGADTLAEARRLGLRAAVLPPRPDLDTVDDVRAALRAGWLDGAPRTRAFAMSVLADLPGRRPDQVPPWDDGRVDT
jgi:hypothetical protein